ncbi:endonuclease [Flavobacterium sp.]|uniref:endonuclease n=1 Tax=Flavobacterium sp. TaxID=239 RepID=UPI0025CEE755|nr:endonuclease [Flavobacterium sp.]
MKRIFTLLFWSIAIVINAQEIAKNANAVMSIPPGYYSSATGTGFILKTQLFNKISPHNTISYGSGLWNLFQTSDDRPDGFVWEIYSNCNFIFGSVANGGQQDDGTLGTAECQRYNKEHTFPKSWFGGSNTSQMYSDAFIVMPSDKKDNNLRGNLVYATVNPSVTNSIGNGWKIGSCVAPNYPYSLQVFEPADQFKGDFARNYFYMATCYEDQIGTWQTLDPNGDTVLDGSNNKVFEQWYLNLLYSWHIADPVSQKEIDRNDAIYAVQGNRNPFIDHPEYVFQIWGAFLNTQTNYNLSSVSIYPNPSTNGNVTISIDISLDEIVIITINGQVLQQIKKPTFENNSYSVSNLPKGLYFVKLVSSTNSVTKKVLIN